MTRRAGWIAAALALLVAALLGTRLWQAAQSRKADAAAASAAASAPPTLELAAADVLTVGHTELTRGIEVSGALRAVRSAFVKARVAAEVKSVAVREGDTVRAGQVVAQLDTVEFDWRLRQAEQQALAAKAQLDIAQRQLDNNKALVAQDFISPTALQNSESNAAGARSTLNAAQAAVELARKARADATLTAPINGAVAQRLAQPGERVSVDARILEIVDLSAMEVEAAVPPQQSPLLRVGAAAWLTVDGGSEPVPARVVRINPSAQAGARTVPAYLALAPHPSLRQGLFTRGWIELERKTVLALPLTAVRIDQAQPYAVTLVDGRARQRSLSLGLRGMAGGVEMVEIVSGLAAGDRVLAASAGVVPDGSLLRVGASPPAATPAATPARAGAALAASGASAAASTH